MAAAVFQMGAVLPLCYVGRKHMVGEVYARSGIWCRTPWRDGQPVRYWFLLGGYAMLAITMLFVVGRRS